MNEMRNGNTGWVENESGDVMTPDELPSPTGAQLHANHAELAADHRVFATQPRIDSHLPGPAAARQALETAQANVEARRLAVEAARNQELLGIGKRIAEGLIDPKPYLKKDK